MAKSRHMGKLPWLMLAAGIGVAAFGLFWIVEARRAVGEAMDDLDRGLAFHVRSISRPGLAGVEYLPAPPDFVDGRIFDDLLYLAGSGGVWVYDLEGNPETAYLTGRDLPPSRPVALEVGRVSGEAAPRLWIGTSDGLLEFDGARFSLIRLDDPGMGNVTSLLMLGTGTLLVGLSEGGVVAWDGSGMRPFHPDLREVPVTAMDGDAGDLWVGTRDRGVIHVVGGAARTFGTEDGMPAPHVLSIDATGDRTFVGTAVGVAEFSDGRYVRPVAEGTLALSLLAVGGDLLIGTIDEGVIDVVLDGARGRGFGPGSDSGGYRPRRLLELRQSAFALTSDALLERDETTGLWTERITARPVWTDRNVSAIAFDRYGQLWIGYFDRGVDVGDVAGGLPGVLHIEDDQVFCVNRIVSDPYRDVQVVATANGMVRVGLDGTVLQRLGREDGLISEHVTDVAVHPDGLIAATAAGVTFMTPSGPESIYAFHGLANNHVYALAMRNGDLMAGTLGGLSRIEDGFVRASYTTSNSPLRNNWISAIVSLETPSPDAPAAGGAGFLVGTYGGGVMRLDGKGAWSDFPDIPEGTVVNPNAMLAADGRVFAGTLEDGLLVYDPERQRWRGQREGLPSLNVTALAVSGDRLFIGTDNGAISVPLGGAVR